MSSVIRCLKHRRLLSFGFSLRVPAWMRRTAPCSRVISLILTETRTWRNPSRGISRGTTGARTPRAWTLELEAYRAPISALSNLDRVARLAILSGLTPTGMVVRTTLKKDWKTSL